MAGSEPSGDHTRQAVRRTLAARAAAGEPVNVVALLSDDIPAAELEGAARAAVAEAEKAVGQPDSIRLGKVRSYARTASLSGSADAIDALWDTGKVKQLEPDPPVDSALIAPVRRRAVE